MRMNPSLSVLCIAASAVFAACSTPDAAVDGPSGASEGVGESAALPGSQDDADLQGAGVEAQAPVDAPVDVIAEPAADEPSEVAEEASEEAEDAPVLPIGEFVDATAGWEARSELATAGGGLAWPDGVAPLVSVVPGTTCMIDPDSGNTLTPARSVYEGDYYSNNNRYGTSSITSGWSVSAMHGSVDAERSVGSARQSSGVGRLFLLDPVDSWVAATESIEGFVTAVAGSGQVVAIHTIRGLCTATRFDGALQRIDSQFLPEGACEGVVPALDGAGGALFVGGAGRVTRVDLDSGAWTHFEAQGDLLAWSEAHDSLYVASFGGDTVASLDREGGERWTQRVAGATTALTTSDTHVFVGQLDVDARGAVLELAPEDGSGSTILRSDVAPTSLWAEPASGRVAIGEGQRVRVARRR